MHDQNVPPLPGTQKGNAHIVIIRILLVVFLYLANTFRLGYLLLYLNYFFHYLVLSISKTFFNPRKQFLSEQSTKLGIMKLQGKAEPITNLKPIDRTQN